MKRGSYTLAWVWIMGLVASCQLIGCFEEEEYYNGNCAEDADLRSPDNFYEGATCVDGRAQCADGQTFCERIAHFDDRDRVIQSCLGPCITCPDHKPACIALDRDTKQLYHLCVDTFSDCFQDQNFLALDSGQERCPLMTPDCW